MKNLIPLLALLLGLTSIELHSQTLAVESFTLAPTDMTANISGTMVRDQNGEVCALIKLETTQKGFTFSVGVLGVCAVEEKPAEIWVYVPHGIRKITIQHPQLGMIRDYQIPCAIDKGRTYVMKLASGSVRTIVEYAASKQFLSIELDPADAILEINGKIKPVKNGLYSELLQFGKYNYRVSSPNYHDLVGVVEVSDPNQTHSLKLRLKPAFGHVSVTERSHPEIKGASVYIDQKYIGTVPVDLYQLNSGSHSIRVIKEMYEVYEEQFAISDEEKKVLSPILTQDFAEVTLKTVQEADIYVNGELKGRGSWKGRLASGAYIFETRRSGHITYKMSYDITRNDHLKTIAIQAPTPVYGSLVVSSEPTKAKVYIDGVYVGETPKFIGKQVGGEHEVKVELNGYISQKKKVNVLEGKEASVSFNLTNFLVLSAVESANCYIVSAPGTYAFATVKGNSSKSVGNVVSAEVLWESYGTSVVPKKGSLIKEVKYSDGNIIFKTPSTFYEGNAVIAAKNADGKILWSWHIWLTDKPKEDVYEDYEMILMDRNLGATSATPGQVGSLGLMYQWGRKDPFLGSSSISQDIKAKSTIKWPEAVPAYKSIDYTIAHPTTFVKNSMTDSRYKWDWVEKTETVRWDKEKTIYDPCPPGWSVPDAELEEALVSYSGKAKFDTKKKGVIVPSGTSDGKNFWYPAAGSLHYEWSGNLRASGKEGYLWTSTETSLNSIYAVPVRSYNMFSFKKTGTSWEEGGSRANGYSVRCVKNVQLDPSAAVDLSIDATANSYIVSEKGIYKFAATKGNTRLSVGKIKSLEVLWEASGTEEKLKKQDLIGRVEYADSYIVFRTSRKYNKGNAVIAAKGADGNILWSWHIWFTDRPNEHVSSNGAGIMMDRNLGAVSKVKDDPGSSGLMYQWGRKDPFPERSSLDLSTRLIFNSVTSDSICGTIEYSIANPTVYIINSNSDNYDWYYNTTYYLYETDNTRWQSVKTMYDPCPPGWRVPDGGINGVWTNISSYDYASYPDMDYWSCTPCDWDGKFKCEAYAFSPKNLKDTYTNRRTYQCAVRCIKEKETNPYSVMSDLNGAAAEDLSAAGAANCYIVSKPGLYKFKTVKGNTEQSVGDVVYCAVLWESYGTKELPKRGKFVNSVDYEDGYVVFRTPDVFDKGNAVITAISKDNKMLWSWHIWLTDMPQEQVYNNNAGVVMDRNLGAISAEPVSKGDNGLLYQWGRKDPICSRTATVPDIHFEELKNSYDKWEFKWNSSKSVNDPCPAGWRVPDGGTDGFWAAAYPKKTKFTNKYDKDNRGMNLTKKFGIDKVIWYPESKYWTCTVFNNSAYNMSIDEKCVNTVNSSSRTDACSVRCVKE